MIRLTDSELDQVFRAALPLPVGTRDQFLQIVAERLSVPGTTPGPGTVYRVCCAVQKELLNGNYPQFGSGHWSNHRG
jgi:hypothetical protein